MPLDEFPLASLHLCHLPGKCRQQLRDATNVPVDSARSGRIERPSTNSIGVCPFGPPGKSRQQFRNATNIPVGGVLIQPLQAPLGTSHNGSQSGQNSARKRSINLTMLGQDSSRKPFCGKSMGMYRNWQMWPKRTQSSVEGFSPRRYVFSPRKADIAVRSAKESLQSSSSEWKPAKRLVFMAFLCTEGMMFFHSQDERHPFIDVFLRNMRFGTSNASQKSSMCKA
mmetsp:Transcript_18337/g.50301  ORF Transcript_18337/g.50301 Transcript_18337/m.50301 type:complete len:225 (-) Transcript_18337:377-1051(-)